MEMHSMFTFTRFIRQTAPFLLAVFLTSCASSHVLVGQPRPPIRPSEVKLYLQPPVRYEQVALLEGSSRNSFAIGQQAKMNAAIERLKEEAASLGANGILLQTSGDGHGGTVNTVNMNGNFGMGVGIPVMHKTASGIAIYVPPDAEASGTPPADSGIQQLVPEAPIASQVAPESRR